MAVARAKKESGEEEEGKKEDDAGASDFERTAQMQRISAFRFRSDGGDELKRYAHNRKGTGACGPSDFDLTVHRSWDVRTVRSAFESKPLIEDRTADTCRSEKREGARDDCPPLDLDPMVKIAQRRREVG